MSCPPRSRVRRRRFSGGVAALLMSAGALAQPIVFDASGRVVERGPPC